MAEMRLPGIYGAFDWRIELLEKRIIELEEKIMKIEKSKDNINDQTQVPSETNND